MREYCIAIKRPEGIPLSEVILVVDMLHAANLVLPDPGCFR